MTATITAPSSARHLHRPRGGRHLTAPTATATAAGGRNWGVIAFMTALHLLAVVALLPQFWSWQALIVLAALYWTTVLGVTLGLHRLVAHRSFVAPKWLERLLVLMGSLACQSGPIEWVGLHRHHHKFSDQPKIGRAHV